MIYQNDIKLNEQINEYGCFCRCATAIPELYLNKELTHEQINNMWEISKELYMYKREGDWEVKNSAGIATLSFKALESDKRVYEVGLFKNGKTIWYEWVENNPSWKRIDALIQKGFTVNDHYHYVVVDKRGKKLFDPWEGGTSFKRVEYSILYRIV